MQAVPDSFIYLIYSYNRMAFVRKILPGLSARKTLAARGLWFACLDGRLRSVTQVLRQKPGNLIGIDVVILQQADAAGVGGEGHKQVVRADVMAADLL